ncbi:MAG: HEAT repeat domain-containing protein, partial [Pyrinomonadaceae bacterium]
MDNLILPPDKRHKLAASLILLLLVLLISAAPTVAQKTKKKGQEKKPQQSAPQKSAPQNLKSADAPKKHLTPLRTSDAPEGSRVTITSDGVLSEYSAYRSGDRFYVVIPKTEAAGAQSGMRGRGYEDVKVQKNGNDTVLSFRLQPGAKARVEQKFNKLEVVINSQEKSQTASNTKQNQYIAPNPSTSPTQAAQNKNATAQATPNASPTVNPNQAKNAQEEKNASATASPSASPQNSTLPALTTALPTPAETPTVNPLAEQVSQSRSQPTQPTAVVPAPIAPSGSTGTSFGAVIARNWLPALIAGLLFLGIVAFVVARSRAQRQIPAQPPRRRLSRKERKALRETRLKDAEAREAAAAKPVAAKAAEKAAPVAAVVSEPVPVVPESVAEVPVAESSAALVAEEEVETIEAAPVAFEEEEFASPTEIERATAETRSYLAGEAYEESVLGSSDPASRSLVAAELIAALAGLNKERRERALQAFAKHNYIDEATYELRTAKSFERRAMAARALGVAKDTTATPHLVAALEDSSDSVRRTVVEALGALRDPAAVAPLQKLHDRKKNRKVSRSVIRQAIQACTATVTAEPEVSGAASTSLFTDAPTAEASVVEAEEEAAVSEEPTIPDEAALAAEEAAAIRIAEEEDAARRKAEEEERQRAEEAARLAEEERQREQAEAARLAEEEAAR